MSVWNVYFDGAVEPINPGGVMTWGWAIDAHAGGLHTGSDGKSADPANTNNVAEYCGLGFALREVLKLRAASELTEGEFRERFDGVRIRGDSKLVVEQVNGSWSVKSARLQPLHARCLELLRMTMAPWVLEWIPREENLLADELSRKAYTAITGRVMPQRYGRAAS